MIPEKEIWRYFI
jgi:NIMA (never in mitosis gene a)-related kinase 1/4/5